MKSTDSTHWQVSVLCGWNFEAIKQLRFQGFFPSPWNEVYNRRANSPGLEKNSVHKKQVVRIKMVSVKRSFVLKQSAMISFISRCF